MSHSETGRWLERNCPLCGRRDTSSVFCESTFDEKKLDASSFASRKLPEFMHFRFLVCTSCDLLYSSPVPPVEWFRSGYRDAGYDSAEEARFASRTYARHLDGFLQALPDREGALDIGTGNGAFLECLQDRAFKRIGGVEPSEAPVNSAKPSIRPLIRQELFSEGSFDAEQYALVTCFQTLEHVEDPKSICSSAYTLLKDGGAFFIVSHNYRSFSSKLLGTRSPIFDIEHLQLFSMTSMGRLLETVGFKNPRVCRFANTYPLEYWLKLLPLPPDLKSGLHLVLRKTGLGRLSLPLPAGNLAAVCFKT
jgi:SAM-dependent methyltransferase